MSHGLWLRFICILLFINVTLSLYCDDGPCGPGQFLADQSRGLCQRCPDQHYMDLSNHGCLACFKCKTADVQEIEVVDRECSPVSDAVILCKPGYFMSRGADPREHGICRSCSPCGGTQWVVRECQGDQDTECCSGERMETSPGVFTCAAVLNVPEPPVAVETHSQMKDSSDVKLIDTVLERCVTLAMTFVFFFILPVCLLCFLFFNYNR